MKRLISILTIVSFIYLPQVHAQFTNVMIDNNFDPEEPSIAINPLNTNQIIAGSNTQNSYYSTDGGATWNSDFINSTLGESGDPCLVADSAGNFFYFHLANSLDKVICQRSTDGGISYNDGSYTWNNNSLLEDKEWATVDPHTNNIYVTWTEYDNGFTPGPTDSSRIYFARSTDHGNTFTDGKRINQYAGDCLWLDITDPHPFVGINGEIYVTFMDSAGIRFNKSIDTGNTWLTSQPLIETGSVYRYDSIAGVSRLRSMPYSSCDRSNSPYRGNLYVSWADQRNGLGINNSDIFFIKSTDGGNNWTSALRVNTDNTTHSQYRNAMTVDQTNGYIYIVYYDRRNFPNDDSTDVYMSKSTDGGDHWTDYKISNSAFYTDGTQFDGDYIDISAHAGIVRPVWTRLDGFSLGIWTCLYNENSVGISSIKTSQGKFNFTVNPNPADYVAVISFSEEADRINGTISDASGRIVSSFTTDHEREKIISLENLSAGIYFIKAAGITRKLIIEK